MHSPNAPAALLDDIQCTLDSVAASDRTGLNVGKNSQEAIRLAASGDERTQKLIMLSMLDCIHLQVGALVTFVGLQARPQLNGRHGVIIGDRAGARYPVHVCGMTAIHSQRGSLFTVTDGPGSGMPERLSVKPCSLRHWMPDEADRPQAAALDLCRFAMDQDSVSLLETVLGAMSYHGPDAEEVLNIPVNKEHNRLLSNVAQSGQTDFAAALLESGADATLQNADGATALGVASYFGHDGIVRLIVEHDRGVHALHLADHNGAYPLTLACAKGRVSTVELLLSSARDAAAAGLIAPFSQSQLHSAALDAIDHQQERCVEPLLAAGLDAAITPPALGPNHVDMEPSDPLTLQACQTSDDLAARRILRTLLDAGAIPDARAADEFTSFNVCCQKGHARLAKVLLAAGADPTIPSKLCCSPVLSALDSDHHACADLALEACRARSTRLGDPSYLEQAEADVASFHRLPRPSPSALAHALAAQTPEDMKFVGHIDARTLTTQDELVASECAVCITSFVARDRVVRIGCGHQFHTICLCGWVDIAVGNQTCPVCHAKVRVA